MAIEMIGVETFNRGTHIKVIGVGGGGGNAVSHMIASNVLGIDFVCANTDAQALNTCSAGSLIQLGTTGLGAGGKPDRAREAAELATDSIRQAIDGAHMLFITAGMGGGTGSGAAPVIARIAREMGILTVGVVTKPFEFEGKRRMNQAEAGLKELEANVDSLIVVLNEKLLTEENEDILQEQAFALANDVLRNAVGGLAEVINVTGQVNVDFEDVKSIMEEPGKAIMGTAVASGPDRAGTAATQALICPLLEGLDLSSAKGVVVLVSGSKSTLKLSESKQAMNTVSEYASPEAIITYGSAYDETLGDQIRVTVLATGLSQPRPKLQVVSGGGPRPLTKWRTGSNDLLLQGAACEGQNTAPTDQGPMRGQSDVNTPAVWRTNRERNIAGRADALSSGGMSDIEIPAYLRALQN